MQNMLSLTDPMVIFTQPQLVPAIAQHRTHAPTVLIELQLTDLPLASLQSSTTTNDVNNNSTMSSSSSSSLFWRNQLHLDPEQRIHNSYELFWIWLSKTWFVQQAIDQNYFPGTDFFVWSDIGCFRRKKQYSGTRLVNPAAVHAVLPPPMHASERRRKKE